MDERVDGANRSPLLACSVAPLLSDAAPGLADFDRFRLAINIYVVGGLCIFGISGNIVSILVLGRDHSIRRTTGFLLQMLALSDIAFLVSCIFYQTLNDVAKFTDWIPSMRHHWPYVEPYTWPFASTAQTCTVWLVVLVTADRYIAICKPLQSPQYSTVSRMRVAVFVVWVLALLYNLPRFFERIVVDRNHTDNSTFAEVRKSYFREHHIYVLVYKTGMFFLIRFLFPFSLLAYFNTRLIQAIRNSGIIQMQISGKEHQPIRRKERYTLTLVVVVLVFVFCELPDLFLRLWIGLQFYVPLPKTTEIKYINIVSNLLLAVNSCANFLIYCFMGRQFRTILLQILCRRKKKIQTGVHQRSIYHLAHRRGNNHNGEVNQRVLPQLRADISN